VDKKSLKIGAIAPGFRPTEQQIDTVKQWVLEKGFHLVMPSMTIHRSLAVTDEEAQQILQDFIDANDNPEIDVIWALRGGYGSAYLAQQLALCPHIKQKKPIIGFSDLTAVFTILCKKHGWKCIHGPTLAQMPGDKLDEDTKTQTLQILSSYLSSQEIHIRLQSLTLPHGYASDTINGIVMGGNLSTIITSLATPWQLDFKDKILMLEDVDEAPYRIDRMLNQMLQSGLLNEVKAIVLGNFYGDAKEMEDLSNTMQGLCRRVTCPVYCGGPFGHTRTNLPFILNEDAVIAMSGKEWCLTQHINTGV
jgi:muramoyltetrapeptide carboxypeptidase